MNKKYRAGVVACSSCSCCGRQRNTPHYHITLSVDHKTELKSVAFPSKASFRKLDLELMVMRVFPAMMELARGMVNDTYRRGDIGELITYARLAANKALDECAIIPHQSEDDEDFWRAWQLAAENDNRELGRIASST